MNAQYLEKAAQVNPVSLNRNDKHPLILVHESGAQRGYVDETIIRAAMSGPVLVMDAGNCFNPLRMVRRIRQQTLQVQQVLEQIQVARAFTCFQVVTLLEQTYDPQGPVFILRPLTTFNDEIAPVYERLRLLRRVDQHIERLQNTVTVTVMIKGSQLLEDPLMDWLSALQARADKIVFPTLTRSSRPATFF